VGEAVAGGGPVATGASLADRLVEAVGSGPLLRALKMLENALWGLHTCMRLRVKGGEHSFLLGPSERSKRGGQAGTHSGGAGAGNGAAAGSGFEAAEEEEEGARGGSTAG
jgi:hypothetical protein